MFKKVVAKVGKVFCIPPKAGKTLMFVNHKQSVSCTNAGVCASREAAQQLFQASSAMAARQAAAAAEAAIFRRRRLSSEAPGSSRAYGRWFSASL